jgi:microcin C transport system ATP-binding protein
MGQKLPLAGLRVVDLLLRDLQARHDLACLFISHDLKVVRAMADELIVMREGRVVEQGPAARVFDHPESRRGGSR